MTTPIREVGYSPWILRTSSGPELLVQIFVDLETGLIDSVSVSHRRDDSVLWGPAMNFERF